MNWGKLICQINVRENRRGNQEWAAIQRHWQHWIHMIQNEDKLKKEKNTTQKTKNQVWTTKAEQFLLLIRHPPCYS
jgi:hypothetical protein